MGVSDDVAPDEWECRVFLAVVANKGHTKAAEELSPVRPQHLRDRPYARQSVGNTIARIERWCGGEKLFVRTEGQLRLTARGREFELAARNVVAEYRLMRREPDRGPSLPRLACLPHHAQFVARAQAMLLERSGRARVEVQYLEQRHRGESEFRHHAVARLQQDLYRILIGPPVAGAEFVSRPLYEARLEAMVPVAHFAGGAMPLTDLIQRHRLLLPPRDARSRRLMEQRIREWGIDDHRRDERVAAETFDTCTSVMRLRHEASGDRWDGCVVVAPSDVALAFKPGREFGGLHADRFTWVPVVHRTADGGTHRLPLAVNITVRADLRRQDPDAARDADTVIDAITTAVGELGW